MNTGTVSVGVEAEKKKIAIIGLPNTGKSLIFSHLTGEYTVVANYPLTTVEVKRRDCRLNGCSCQVIDTPGLHCLSAHSEEELAIRDMVIRERPDLILQCIDANRLKQSLTLTGDLLELGVPMVVSLNAIDETARRGIWIDRTALAELLGVPVVETIATQGHGISELKETLAKASTPPAPVRYGDTIEDALSDMEELLGDGVPQARKIALLMCMGDPFIESSIGDLAQLADIGRLRARAKKLRLQLRGDVATVVAGTVSRWVDEIAEKIIRRQKVRPTQFSNTFGHLCRHPIFGIPIALFFLMVTYYLVVHVAGAIEGALNAYLADPIVSFLSGAIPPGFWNDLIVGESYGLLTLGLFNAICTVLPILSVFFLVFGIVEDIGYIPSLCVLTKRIFEKVGLKGNAIMSLALGFGCKTMATLTTVGLPRKEKIIAIYLISATVPCSAQMGLSMGLLGRFAFWTLLVTYGTLLGVAIMAGILLNKVIPDESSSDFIQALPPIRLPNPRAVVIKTYYRLYWFLKEALPIFLIAALALFLGDKLGLLDAIRTVLAPLIVGWLGLPVEVVDALVVCIARHEIAASMLINMADLGKLNAIQCMEAVLLTIIFIPCSANIVAMCRRVGLKTGIAMTAAMNVSAFAVVAVFYRVALFFMGRSG